MDAALRAAERTYASVSPAGAGVTWSMIEAARAELNRQRLRAGLPALCAECGDANDEREENCECEEPRCRACHDAIMEHGHRHVHDADDRVRCCRACFREHEDERSERT